jgi:hypothetical protein
MIYSNCVPTDVALLEKVLTVTFEYTNYKNEFMSHLHPISCMSSIGTGANDFSPKLLGY